MLNPWSNSLLPSLLNDKNKKGLVSYMLKLVSTFKKFKLITEENEQGTFITSKVSDSYNVQLNLYWTKEQAEKGHQKFVDFYSKKSEWSTYIKDVAQFK